MYEEVLDRWPDILPELECLNFPLVSWCRVKEGIRLHLHAMPVPTCRGFNKDLFEFRINSTGFTDEAPPSSSLLRPVH